MSSPSPRRRRFFSCLGCLVAGPLGCLSFVGGAMAIFAMFAPELVEKLIVDEFPERFEELFEGELSIELIDLAWTGVQRLEGIELRDDRGRLVLRFSLELPPILALMGESDLGQTTLRIEGDIRVDENGSSNLDRILTLSANADHDRRSSFDLRDALEFCLERKGEVVVEVSRLSWTVARKTGVSTVIAEEVRSVLQLGNGGALKLDLNGGLASGGEDRSGTVVLEARLDREAFFAPKPNGHPGVWGSLIAEDLPVELLDIIDFLDLSAREVLDQRFDFRFTIDSAEGDHSLIRSVMKSGEFTATASGEIVSSGLLAVRPRFGAVERLSLDAILMGVPARSLKGALGLGSLRQLGDAGLSLDWSSEQPFEVSLVELEWMRRGDKPAWGSLELGLPDSRLKFSGERSLKLFQTRVAIKLDESAALSTKVTGYLGSIGGGLFNIDWLETPSDENSGLNSSRVLTIHGSSLPIAELEQGLALEGQLSAALGQTADLRFEYSSADDGGGPMLLVFGSDRMHASFKGKLIGAPTNFDQWIGAVDFVGQLDGAEALPFAPFLSPENSIDWTGPIDVAYQGWRERPFARGDDIGSDPLARGPAGEEDSGSMSGGSLTISMPELVYRKSAALEGQSGLVMTDVNFFAHGNSDVLRVDFSAGLEPGGDLKNHWTFYELSGPFGRDGHEDLRLRAVARSLPALYLDQRLQTEGLIADLFGDTVDVEVNGSGLSRTGGRIRGDLWSKRAVASFEGFQQNGDTLIDTVLELEFPLDELATERIVRPLLPFVESIVANEREETMGRLILDGATLPLEGDWLRLVADARLELGGASVRYPERFESFLLTTEDSALHGSSNPVELAPLEFALASGRVECKQVALPIRGHLTQFEGNFGFGGSDLDLQIELPLRMVGSEINLLLHNVRDRFQPDFGVPIEISGADVSQLDFAVRPQWVRTVDDILGQLVPDDLLEAVRGILAEEETAHEQD